MSNSRDSGSGRNCSGPKLLRSRDFERPLVGLCGVSGCMANEDKSFVKCARKNIQDTVLCY